jgi:hypothetical protein
MNIKIPEELAKEMSKLTRSRTKSQFIAEAVRQKIEKVQSEKLQKSLEEGYKARRDENRSMAKEFEVTDLEGWDEF